MFLKLKKEVSRKEEFHAKVSWKISCKSFLQRCKEIIQWYSFDWTN